MPAPHIVVIGAGIGGLVASLELAVAGHAVTLLERQASPGGKMREIRLGDVALDAGPTVFTMRWVFEEIFAAAGARFDDCVGVRPARVLARHAWGPGETLDLFADLEESADAIGRFAGAAEARGFRAFSERAARIYRTLEGPFLRGARPTPLSLARAAGVRAMLAIRPFDSLMAGLDRYFADPRLTQLFGRYATYCGSSPYLAPATLMLVAHVEREGVWLVQGGMHRLAVALAALASRHGVVIRYGAEVRSIRTERGRVCGVLLAEGEHIAADAVVLNADPASLPAGFFGADVAGATPPRKQAARSLSAVTWALHAPAEGFALSRHNVFFGADYAGEFRDIFDRGTVPGDPTIYVCAQDRADDDVAPPGAERLLCLMNAPARGDGAAFSEGDIERCGNIVFSRLARSGLHIRRTAAAQVVTTPAGFEALFPGTGGALYGPAVHGSMATFRRPGSQTRVAGLYLAGGATHPGAGVPMAALSGRLAAARVMADGFSTGR